MPASSAKLSQLLRRVESAAASLGTSASSATTLERFRNDVAAAQFHLSHAGDQVVVVLGGTGTGKSTLVNRLLGQTITSASFRRTFTAGCVAIIGSDKKLPAGWLGVEHATTTDIPARGVAGQLTVITPPSNAPPHTLVDTPDLDGDQPLHHAQADRAFRWATAVVFVVTPEKYQMTELLPYYRLAARYGVPAAFVMNKCEDAAVVEDFSSLLVSRDWPRESQRLFVIPRDDAPFEPQAGQTLADLRHWIERVHQSQTLEDGIHARLADLTSRLRDHAVAPARQLRSAVDGAIAQLKALETPSAGIDVNPLTQQLQRRLQQRSVLYLMGPQRVLDRARQIPSLLARLPRAAWDYVVTGELPKSAERTFNGQNTGVPDFNQLLADSLAVVRSRIDDVVRASPALSPLAADPSYQSVFLPPVRAGAIADEELASLRQWLETRWDANPRDTRLLHKLLKVLPGGATLTKWSETAPYLLAIVVATHHAFFGHVDLLILGGYSLATWLTERVSNEVTARTRATNRRISDRFTDLAHEQITAFCRWLDERVPDKKAIDTVERAADELEEALDSQSSPSPGGRGGRK